MSTDQCFPMLEEIAYKVNPAVKLAPAFWRGINNLNYCRNKRIERTEGIRMVLSHIIKFMSLSTFEIGYMAKGKLIALCPYQEIAKATGLHIKSVKRVFCDLKAAGYMRVTKQYKTTKEGKYVAFTAVKRFTERFFNDLGISSVYRKKLQDWRRKKDGLDAKPQDDKKRKTKQHGPIQTRDYILEMQKIANAMPSSEGMSPADMINRIVPGLIACR